MTAARNTLTVSALRTVVMALMTGLVVFAIVAVVLREQGLVAPVEVANGLLPILVMIVFLSCASSAVLIRFRMIEVARRSKEESLAELRADRVPPVLGQLTLIGAALVEGPGLLGIVTVLIGGPWYCLAAPFFALGMMFWNLPSRQRFEELIQGV